MRTPEVWATATETARHLKVSRSTFERMIPLVPIPFVRPTGPQGPKRFYLPHVDAALLKREQFSAKPAA